jgi:hypothetical protein
MQVLPRNRFAATGVIACVFLLALSGCGVIPRFNEDHAIGAMEAIRDAEVIFKSKNGFYGTLDDLARIHWGIPSRTQNDYVFALRASAESYVATAVPTRWKERSLSLYLDQSGIIRGMFKNGGEANASDGRLNGYGINPQDAAKSLDVEPR